MIWACFAASEPGWLAIVDGTSNCELYKQIVQENVKVSICEMALNRKWIMHQDNDLTRTSCSSKEYLKE